MKTPEKTPIQNPLTVLRVEFDDWAILFDPDSARTMGINPTGVAIWKLIDGRKGIEDVVKKSRRSSQMFPFPQRRRYLTS